MRATSLLLVLAAACTTATDSGDKDTADTGDTAGDTADTDTDSGSANTAPTAPTVEIRPAAPNDASDLVATITADASDIDGDPITYRFVWSQNGAERTDLATATVDADQTTDGDTWSVSVYATDGKLESAAATSTATVGNFPPVAPTIHLDPDPLVSGGDITLVFDATASDANGDVLDQTIEWYVNGAKNASWDDRTAIDGMYVDGGEVYRAVVTVTDGWSDPVVVEVTGTVPNTPPEITSVSITPTDPGDHDDLSCVARVTDADGGTPTKVYTWFRDGIEATDVGDSSTVTADFTTVGELWECQVEASDGFDTVTMMSSGETIQPPTGYRVTMNVELTIYDDTAGNYATAEGDFDLDVVSSGSYYDTNDCYAVWSILAAKDNHCRGCTYSFDAEYTYDAAASSIVSGCTGVATDSTGEIGFLSPRTLLEAELTDAYYNLYYFSPGYAVSFQEAGTGGYAYTSYGYTRGHYYSVVETADAYGNVVLTGYSTNYSYQ